MRIIAFQTRELRWPMPRRGSARDRGERAALLIEIRTESGVIGLGEAAPLPGTSRDTLIDVRRALEEALPRLVATELPGAAEIEHFGITVDSPAARFAIETAALSALAVRDRVSLARLVAPGAHIETAFAMVVDDADEARRAIDAGVRCLKIKVGADGDLARVRQIARAAPGIALRIDANQTWPRASVLERLAALCDLAPIEYVEEPCLEAHQLPHDALPCPLALDETLVTLAPEQLDAALHSPSLGALVLKPTLLGGWFACLALAERAHTANVHAIISHTLEGPVGTAACAELARAVADGAPTGLAPHPGLTSWRIAVPQLTARSVRGVDHPALGFELLDLATLVAAAPEAG